MKKSILAASIIALCFGIVSCNNPSTKNNKHIDPFSVNSGDENRDIIAYNNKLVEIDNVHTQFIINFGNSIKQMHTYVQTMLANPQATSIKPIFTPSIRMPMNNDTEVPKVLGSDFQGKMDSLTVTYDELQGLYKELTTYKDGEDWKDDKGEKLEEINQQYVDLWGKHRRLIGEMFDGLTEKADKAEAEALKNHPLKEHILQSKKLLVLTEDIVNGYYNATDEAAYQKQFIAQYDELEKLHKANESRKIPSSAKEKEASYTKFNDAVNEFLSKMRVIKRNFTDNPEEAWTQLDQLTNDQKTVLNRYNSFVQ